jgi:hypothetical protein
VFDHSDDLVAAVALGACVFDEFVDTAEHGSALWCAGDRDAAAASEFEQSFVTEGVERAQDGVGVDTEDGCEVFGERQPVAWAGFAVGDCAADLSRGLQVEGRRFRCVDLAIQYGTY